MLNSNWSSNGRLAESNVSVARRNHNGQPCFLCALFCATVFFPCITTISKLGLRTTCSQFLITYDCRNQGFSQNLHWCSVSSLLFLINMKPNSNGPFNSFWCSNCYSRLQKKITSDPGLKSQRYSTLNEQSCFSENQLWISAVQRWFS